MNRHELTQSIAERIADYREGEVTRPTPEHVERWIRQFHPNDQDVLLVGLNHLLERTYISKSRMTRFLSGLATNEKFCSGDPENFWRMANVLDIQQGGNSQRELVAMFSCIVKNQLGIAIGASKNKDNHYVYIDDGIFSGMRVKRDLQYWLRQTETVEPRIRVVVAALHAGGEYYAKRELSKLWKNASVNIEWWRCASVENRCSNKDTSDVFWPTSLPNEPLSRAYIRYVTEEEPTYKIQLRTPGSIGENKFFPSDDIRIHMEQTLLSAGLEIRNKCTNLPEVARPLGFTGLKTLGFGSTIVTFRNCPNNTPLAFWAGDPWYPLFPRSTNTDAFTKNLIESFKNWKK